MSIQVRIKPSMVKLIFFCFVLFLGAKKGDTVISFLLDRSAARQVF